MRAPTVVALLLAACGPPRIVAHPPPGSLDSIAWMQGWWRATDEAGITDELWVPTGERTWMGLNRTTEAGRTTHHELLRMELHGAGVRYVAAPAGQATTAFALVAASEAEARFENPAHDFPTWIRYEHSQRSLTAAIGGAGSEEPAATWRFARHGDAPPLVDSAARVCRDGGRLAITVPPCTCGAEILCAGFETERGLDVHVAVLDHGCDACMESTGSCELPGGEVTRVNGRPVAVGEDGCLAAPVPILALMP